ncbi:metal-dependent hydrolase family protein [Mycetocola reblochoni]|uniref:Xaa-Pro dipeptidase n=2 Tax=Mycetocola reblochoni TaxID=331618 RepID=A0A1R4IU02_9MICO|nr:amidohydrolase family protein [Mycetocola reblochoni]RLP71050.1 amidohydrolase family protein [Mycetocola reblochoni]SJN23188.1 Xaa-Pro dipeptidase [Mycetocola reblochoni REB411]
MPAAPTTVFRSARVFDGHAFLDAPRDVVVRQGRVAAVEPGSSEIGGGVDVVECEGRTLVPGLVDAHVHLMVANANPMRSAQEPFSLPFYRSVNSARTMLRSGVTSARDLTGADAGLREAIDEGVIAGPKLSIAVNALSITGGHGDNWLRSGVTLHHTNPSLGVPSGIADGVEEVRKVTRTMLRAGADVIKVCATGGVMSTNDHPDHTQFGLDELRVIVEEAEAHGSYVAAHAIGTQGIKNAILAGARTIEHAIYLDDEAIELMLDRDVVLVPTLTAPRQVLEYGGGPSGLPDNILAKARGVVGRHLDSFRRAVDAGVVVAMGSDSGIGPHGLGLTELPAMAEAGMPVDAILRSATSIGARLLPNVSGVGEIRRGSAADLVLLDLELTASEQLAELPDRIVGVWKDGALVE